MRENAERKKISKTPVDDAKCRKTKNKKVFYGNGESQGI